MLLETMPQAFQLLILTLYGTGCTQKPKALLLYVDIASPTTQSVTRLVYDVERRLVSDTTRALLVRIRGLLLLAVDLIDRECHLGKYGVKETVTIQPTDTIAGL